MIRPGRFEIAKVGENTYEVRLGQVDYQDGDSSFYFTLRYKADASENIGMESWPGDNSPNETVIQEFAFNFPWDSLIVTNPKYITCTVDTMENSSPYMDVYYVDEIGNETILASGVTEYTWPPPVKKIPKGLVVGSIALVGIILLSRRKK
jgi:hypothetical protein